MKTNYLKNTVKSGALFFLMLRTLVSLGQPQVVFPNGGQTLTVGSTVTITWSGTALGTIVGIDYTIDNWVNTIWLNTNYSNPAANSYTWVVPNTPGTQCKIGIFDTNFQGDISDNFFTIAAGPAAAPVANFSYAGLACSNKTINFSDASSNSPTTWSWSVTPAASISNPAAQNPAILFSSAGTYSVSLVSSNTGGSSAPVTKTINILPSPSIQVSSSASLICKGETASLTAGGAASYVWNSGASTSVIVVSPSLTTSYSVTGTNTANCSGVASYTLNVNACTALQELNTDSDYFSFFPNPAKDRINITFSYTHLPEGSQIQLYAIDGKLLRSDTIKSNSMNMDLENLKPGIYFMSCVSATKTLKTLRLVVE